MLAVRHSLFAFRQSGLSASTQWDASDAGVCCMGGAVGRWLTRCRMCQSPDVRKFGCWATEWRPSGEKRRTKSDRRRAKRDHAILDPRVTELIHTRGLPAIVVAFSFALVARILGAVTDGG